MNHYQESGVDIQKADGLVDWLKSEKSQVTTLGNQVSSIGGFAALFKPDFREIENPILVSSTDGVGTKLLLGLEQESLSGIGQDLVAMCINDLYTIGATPLFFLDYFATGKLQEQQFKDVVGGIKKACQECNTILIGGETAELPGLYENNHFDLAGFVVGVVDESKILGAHRVKPTDKIIALNANGFHSNGYSLIRKWFQELNDLDKSKYAHFLLQPTRLYTLIPELVKVFGGKMHAAANITGGGISGNLNRVLPDGLKAQIDANDLPKLPLMHDFIKQFVKSPNEVEDTFNLGAGMMLIVDATAVSEISQHAQKLGFDSTIVGTICEQEGSEQVVYI